MCVLKSVPFGFVAPFTLPFRMGHALFPFLVFPCGLSPHSSPPCPWGCRYEVLGCTSGVPCGLLMTLEEYFHRFSKVDLAYVVKAEARCGVGGWDSVSERSFYTCWIFFLFQTLLISFLHSTLLYQSMQDIMRGVTIMTRLQFLHCMCK